MLFDIQTGGGYTETKQYDLVINLTGNRKLCNSGHKVCDEWLWQEKTLDDLCWVAYNSISSIALVFKYGGAFPWQQDSGVITASCPDSEVVNVFELRRIPKN